MRFARRRLEEPSINLTSLIDIVFLLLIFFMVSTRFVDGPKLPVTLPAADAATQRAHANPIEVVVDARDHYYIGDDAVAGRRLTQALTRRHRRRPQRALVLRADGRASHAAVVRVLDIAAAHGFDSVDIAVRQQEQ